LDGRRRLATMGPATLGHLGMTYALLAAYWLAVLGLCLFGLNCLVLC
jgi:hypothetical protein